MKRCAAARYLALLVALAGGFATPATAEAVNQWKLHGWLVGAYTNDRTKSFSHCAASIKYKSGILLLFSVTKDFRWVMGFANPEWRLTTGAKYNIQYAVDSSPALTAAATAVSTQQVAAELPPKTTLFQLFRQGRLLKIQGEGKSFGFSLDNTSSVLAELLRCANRYKSGSNTVASSPSTANPFEKSAPAAPASAVNDAQHRTEAKAVTANVLSAAGIQGFTLVSDIPESLRFLHAIWKAPGMIGGVQILEGQTPTSASSRRIALDAQNCQGTFASGKLPATGNAVRVMSACTADGKAPSRTEYTIIQRSKGGVYMFILMGSGEAPADVSEQGSRVMDAAVKSIR